jgi:hypothetical protein
MGFTGQKVRLMPWKGGLNTVVNPVVLDPQHLTRAENVEFGFDGRRQKRGGSIRLNKVPIIGS